MKTKPPKIIALFFILLGFLPILFIVILHFKKEGIRNRMKQELETSRELHTMTIPADKVIWMDDHEIWVNEHMFDIQSKKLENGVYTFTGLYDEEETEMVLQKKERDKKQNDEKKLLTKLFKWIGNSYREIPEEITALSDNNNDHDITVESSVINSFHKVPTPPPRAHTVHEA